MSTDLKKKKIVIVNDGRDFGSSYTPFFQNLGTVSNNTDSLRDVNLVVFTGGSDVDPSLYNEKKEKRTHSNLARDNQESAVFKEALSLNIPMFGICRGAQFLCVMAGGKLLQHIDNHNGTHLIKTNDGRSFPVNSGHHQMQLPPDDAEIIAWAEPKQTEIKTPEYEAVYYPTIKAVGVQFHPEAMASQSIGSNYALALIYAYLWHN